MRIKRCDRCGLPYAECTCWDDDNLAANLIDTLADATSSVVEAIVDAAADAIDL